MTHKTKKRVCQIIAIAIIIISGFIFVSSFIKPTIEEGVYQLNSIQIEDKTYSKKDKKFKEVKEEIQEDFGIVKIEDSEKFRTYTSKGKYTLEDSQIIFSFDDGSTLYGNYDHDQISFDMNIQLDTVTLIYVLD